MAYQRGRAAALYVGTMAGAVHVWDHVIGDERLGRSEPVAHCVVMDGGIGRHGGIP